MKSLRIILPFLMSLFFCNPMVFSQTPSLNKCTVIGQTPSTAFPVCATTIFNQISVPNCSTGSILVPGCSNKPGAANYRDESPYWYKFTCYQSGTLGFLIKAKNQGDDYDWQLWDITGQNPNVVFSNNSGIIVSGNWAGTYGNTGANASGAAYINCASDPANHEPSFARMPNLIEGHDYLLMVSHYSGSVQSGYELSFGGGTAVITDPSLPALAGLDYSCDGTTLHIKINKRILNNSIAPNGSDFIISNSTATVISAQSGNIGFDTDSIILKLSHPLDPGNYKVVMKKGSDGNTLIDNCGNFLPENDQLPLRILPLQPTPMDSMAPLTCAPKELALVFDKNIDYKTVTTGGQKFLVNGPSAVQVTGTRADVDQNGLTKVVYVTLNQPIVVGGNYTLVLHRDKNGNTFFDECGQETPESSINFTIKDTVNAHFTYTIDENCDKDIIHFSHSGANQVNIWNWQMDYFGKSNVQNPSATFAPPFGDKSISLKVSNGFCSDSTTQIVSLGPELKAAFEANAIICPKDSAFFINQSTGNIVSYQWDFGDGTISNQQNPDPKNFTPPTSGSWRNYSVRLSVTSDKGCQSSTENNLKVLVSCFIAVPTAFTPNGDGLNDALYPLNAFKADSLIFKVYNRFGQKVFESHDWQDKWDGTYKGEPQASGEYAWSLEYTDITNGKRVTDKGNTILIR